MALLVRVVAGRGRHVMSRHVMSPRVASRRVASRRVTSCHLVSRRIASCSIMSCCVISCRVVLCLVASCRFMLVKRAAAALPAKALLRFHTTHTDATRLSSCQRYLTVSAMCQTYLLSSFTPFSPLSPHPRLSVKLQMWGYPVLLFFQKF